MSVRVNLLALTALSLAAAPLAAQPAPASGQEPAQVAAALPAIPFCGQQTPAPRAEPPAGSAPIVLAFGPCFEAQAGTWVIEPQTYLYYIQVKQSRPSEGVWIPYEVSTEKIIQEDF